MALNLIGLNAFFYGKLLNYVLLNFSSKLHKDYLKFWIEYINPEDYLKVRLAKFLSVQPSSESPAD